MSCRPRGPSDRPLHYYYDEIENGLVGGPGGSAPRLQAASVGSRLLIAGVVVCCCGGAALALVFAVSLVLSLPHTPMTAAIGPGASLVAIEQRVDTSPPPALRRTQRSLLARLSTLRRAPPPTAGADPAGLRLTFPHWFDAQSELLPPTAIGDMALALSYLSQEDAHGRG